MDSESKDRGDKSGVTFCGNRLYSIKGEPAYVSVEQTSREILLSTSDDSDVGQHIVKLIIKLEDFPDVTRTVQFQVTVNPCEISSYTVDVTPAQYIYITNEPEATTFEYTFT